MADIGEKMDSAETYLMINSPKKADHLWRYTPWRRVHPTGNVDDVPEDIVTPKLSLTMLDGTPVPAGIGIETGAKVEIDDRNDPVAVNFLRAVTKNSAFTLKVEKNFTSEQPIVLQIQTDDVNSGLHLSLDIGQHCEFEIITLIIGTAPWFGFLRSGSVGNGTILNDVLVGSTDSGILLRIDAINIGRDAQVKVGTISSGSDRTKSDLRYIMDEPGGHLRVLGSILSSRKMQIDHHIEILHHAPETYSRLNWHSACDGESRTIGTGMLRVAKGARGADAGQLFHNLLLSDKAEADSIPELEVSESDVVGCGHGTANGPVDDAQLFYLESRGFHPDEAKFALISAFLNSTLCEMGSVTLHHWLTKQLANGNYQSLLKR